MHQFTPKQMLIAIVDHSANQISVSIARKILVGLSSTVRERERNHGTFMNAVLNGDFATAYAEAGLADASALLTLTAVRTLDDATVMEGNKIFYIDEQEVHSASFVYGYHNVRYLIFQDEKKAYEYLNGSYETKSVFSY